ncbi:MAG: Fe-S cluster assembly sulfur transfer protein SufU [Rudaea sp.]
MESSSLYHEIVLRHKREPRNFGSLSRYTHASQGINALCGDRLHVQVDCADDHLVEMRFTGECCAITVASASIMSEMVVGKDRHAIDAIANRFAQYLSGDDAHANELGELCAFNELRRHSTRRKCALLPWAALRGALAGAVVATTEGAGLTE